MFEVVGIDPIRVSLTSGAGVIGVFSDIEGANWVVTLHSKKVLCIYLVKQ